MTSPAGRPPPGWYPDPSVAGRSRLWDGSGWTDQTKATDFGGGATGVSAGSESVSPPRRKPINPSASALSLWRAITHPLWYSARASRVEYWSLTVVMYAAVVGVGELINGSRSQALIAIPIVLFFPSWIATTVRRLHDTGRAGSSAFYLLIPCIGQFWLWAYCVEAGDQAPTNTAPRPRPDARSRRRPGQRWAYSHRDV
jgi:uncharacterized membrane protein YhaH (DUF805 family)